MWGVYAVQNTWEAGVEREEEQGMRFAELAKNEGVEHFVYSSVVPRTGRPGFRILTTRPVLSRGCGGSFPSYVILRPVFFMENWTSPWFKPGLDEGSSRSP